MKHTIKGYIIWILNNVLLLILNDYGRIIMTTPKAENIIAVGIVAFLWFVTGHVIVVTFCIKKVEHIKPEQTGATREIPYEEE